MIVRDLVDPADTPDELHQAAHLRLRHAHNAGDVAHSRRAKALVAGNERTNPPPGLFVRRREFHLVLRQPDPGAVERDFAALRKPLQNRGKYRRRQARLELQAQPLEPDAGQIRIFPMKRFQLRHQSALQAHEGGRREGDRKIAHRKADQADPCGDLLDFRGRQHAIARERRKVGVKRRAGEQRR